MEIEGTPDMVLEVVSGSSVSKDTEWLRDLYWKAGIAEYWLVDCRGERVDFDILRHTAGGYSATSKSAGWMESAVFGHSFLLTRQSDEMGQPEYTLEARSPRAEASASARKPSKAKREEHAFPWFAKGCRRLHPWNDPEDIGLPLESPDIEFHSRLGGAAACRPIDVLETRACKARCHLS